MLNDVVYTTSSIVTAPSSGSIGDYAGDLSTLGRVVLSGATSSTIEGPGDKDWFKVDNLLAGHNYRVLVAGDGANPLSDTFFTVRDGSGALLTGDPSRSGRDAYEDSGGAHNALVEFTAAQSGAHFISVGGGGPNHANVTGGYRVVLTEVSEPGSTIGTATPIDLNVTPLQGFVGYGADNADFYSFIPQNSGRVTVNLGGLGANLDATLLNAHGAALTGPGDAPSANVAAGQTYYVKVAPAHPGPYSEQSPYTLAASLTGTPVGGGATLKTADTLFKETGGKLATLASFAAGAYHLMGWEPIAPQINDEKPGALDAYNAVIGATNWRALEAADLDITAAPTTSDGHFAFGLREGVFTNDNAAALVAVSADSLVISFRGTNDNRLNGLAGALDKVSILFGGGTPDEDHWLKSALGPNSALINYATDSGMGDHFALFSQLVAQTNAYIDQHSNISNVYVVGHSLGGAMVNAYMDSHPNKVRDNGTQIKFEAITFADPGYFTLDSDNRIVNFMNDSDIINMADFFGATPGDYNTFDDDLFAPVVSHSMQLYLSAIKFLHDERVPEDVIANNGPAGSLDFDNFVFHVDNSGNEIFDIGKGSNSLTGSSKAEILLGGVGNDTYNFNAFTTDGVRYFANTGTDVIFDSHGLLDSIVLGPGFYKPGFTKSAIGDVIVTLSGTGGGQSTITIKDYDAPDHRIESLGWNGTKLTIDQWLATGLLIANPKQPQLVGSGSSLLQMSFTTDAAVDVNLSGGLLGYGSRQFNWTTGTGPALQEASPAEDAGSIVGTSQSIKGFRDVVGTEGNDRIVGDGASNVLTGGAGNDLVIGGSGNDYIVGEADDGDDRYEGGAGNDTIVYSSATQGIVVDLAGIGGQAIGAGFGSDQLIDVENVTAGSGDDNIVGSSLANVLQGRAGEDILLGEGGNDILFGDEANDFLVGGLGNDTLDGGQGNDFVLYDFALAAVIVDLVAGTASGGEGSDRLRAIEGVLGSDFGDNLKGSVQTDNLLGGLGNDTLGHKLINGIPKLREQ